MNQIEFDERFEYYNEKHTALSVYAKRAVCKCCNPCRSGRRFWRFVVGCVPILGWLPKYNLRECLACDIIGGFTTGIMHVPQGIAYAVLSGVDPVYGLYSSFFPALFYMIFGTSRHCSIGSFAVVALMSGIANDRIRLSYELGSIVGDTNNSTALSLTPIAVASTLTFTLGVLQFLAGLLRLEVLTAYFSDQLVSGFTTGSAVHVFIAQIDDVFGVNVPKVSGPGYIFRRAYDIILRIPRANLCTLIVAVIGISFLYIGKELISPLINKKMPVKLPIPYELILVILSAFASFLLNLTNRYGVFIVGTIPAGMPSPQLPTFKIMPGCLMDALAIAAVTIAVHISMAKMLAKKMNYTIDTGQELYALGLSAMLGGCFPIYPISTALGRTMVNVESGTKTQLSTLFSCALLLSIILLLGPLLQTLPMCILAVIIIMALRSMFAKLWELPRLWHVSKFDFSIWVVAFVATVAIDVVEGLVISIMFALLTVIFRSQWAKTRRLAPLSDGRFGDATRYGKAVCTPNVYLYSFDSPLLFTNADRFKKKMLKPLRASQRLSSYSSAVSEISSKKLPEERVVILDCSSIAFVDCMGVNALREIALDLSKAADTTMFFAAANTSVRDSLELSGFFDSISKKSFFPTLADAVAAANTNEAAAAVVKNGGPASPKEEGAQAELLAGTQETPALRRSSAPASASVNSSNP